MDNEGLLEWAEYEVARDQDILKRAEKNRDKLRIIVKEEKDKEAHDMYVQTLKVCKFIEREAARMRRENMFKMVHGMSKEECERAEQSAEAQKSFWIRCGLREEDLEP